MSNYLVALLMLVVFPSFVSDGNVPSPSTQNQLILTSVATLPRMSGNSFLYETLTETYLSKTRGYYPEAIQLSGKKYLSVESSARVVRSFVTPQKTLIIVLDNGKLELIETTSKGSKHNYIKQHNGERKLSIVFSPDGRRVAFSSYLQIECDDLEGCIADDEEAKTVFVWHTDTHQLYSIVDTHLTIAWELTFSPSGEQLLFFNNQSISILDVRQKPLLIARTFEYGNQLRFVAADTVIGIGYLGKRLMRWNYATNDIRFFAPESLNETRINNLDIDLQHHRIAFSLDNGNVILLDLNTGEQLQLFEHHHQITYGYQIIGYDARPVSIVFIPEKNLLVSGGYNGIVKVWDLNTGENTQTIDTGFSDLWELVLRSDGQVLVGIYRGHYQFWKLE